MRHIAKGKAPSTLVATAKASTTNLKSVASARVAYEQLDKGEVRTRLSEDQGGLCAFCMGRIDPGKRDEGRPTIRIAHWKPVDADPSLALDWKNLLGSCSSPLSCDVAQGSAELTTNPTVVGHVAKLVYETFGNSIRLTSLDPNTAADIDVLGLNRGDLPANRHAAWKAFLRLFGRANKGTYGRPAWRAFFQSQPKDPRTLPEYVGVVEAKLL